MSSDQRSLGVRYDGEVKWVPMVVARKMLRVTRQRIYQLLGTGELTGVQMNGAWLISARSLDARLALLKKQEDE